MADSPESDGVQAADDGLQAPLREVDRGLHPRYRTRPREFYLLWSLALLTYGVGDTVTTTLAVFTVPTLAESNLVVAAVIAYGGFSAFLLVKLLVFLVMLAISVQGTRRDDRFTYYWPPVATALVGALLTGWNLWLLATAG